MESVAIPVQGWEINVQGDGADRDAWQMSQLATDVPPRACKPSHSGRSRALASRTLGGRPASRYFPNVATDQDLSRTISSERWLVYP